MRGPSWLRVVVPALCGVLVSLPALAHDPGARLPVDPAVTLGELDNGFRYAVRENRKPEKRAELRLVVRAGSVDEDEDQRGLAHFVEHMVFNGTRSYAGNEIVAYLESVGARFGADLNAYTSFDETVYMLQIPTDREDLLPEGIRILAEFAHAATLDAGEIEKERGVVLDEWRGGLGAGSRIRDRQLPVLLAGSRYAERLPIGKPEVIERCDPEAIRRFYRDWYTPERMALVAVGDFDAAQVVARVREVFGALPAAGSLREPADRAVPAAADTLFALVADPETRGASISLSRKRPAPEDESTRGAYRESLVRQAAASMFNARLAELARSEDPPFLGAGWGASRFGDTELPGLSARVVDGGEARALEALVREERRAVVHGFTESELERTRRDMLAGIEASWAERGKTPSAAFASEYVRHFVEDEPIPGIDAERAIWQAELPGITVRECNAAFTELAGAGGLVVSGARPESAPAPGEEALRAVLREVARADLAPWVDETADGDILPAGLAPGEVVSRREIASIGVTELALSNGMRVFVKPTEFQDDTVLLEGVAPGGTSMAELPELPSAEAAETIVGESGWGGRTPTQLAKLLSGKVASVSPYFHERTHGVSGSSTATDLPVALELAALVMTSPNRDPAAFERVLARSRASLQHRAADPAARYMDRLVAINTRDDPRRRPMTAERLGEIDLDAALEFYRRCFATPADFAFFIVGNVDPGALEADLARTLGAIPAPRGGGRRNEWVDRSTGFPLSSVRETVYGGVEPRATTTLTFHSYRGEDPFEWHRLGTACSILERRLRDRLREDRGATYGVGVGFQFQLPGPSYGRITVRFGSAPEDAALLAEEVLRTIRELRESGPTADEVAKEKELQLRELETNLERNGFWLGNFAALWTRGLPLEDIRDRRARIEALDAKELHRVFLHHFEVDRRTWVDWLPEAGAAGSTAPASGG